MRTSKTLVTGICVLGALFLQTAFAGGHDRNSEVSELDPYFRKEGLDLGIYSKVLIDNLGVADARVIPPPWFEGEARNPSRWQMTEEDIEFLRESYREEMRRQIGEVGGYRIVDQAGEGVLILDVEIISLTPYARRDQDVIVRGFGELRTQAQIRDGMTGELLAVYEGMQEVGSEYQQNTRMNAEQSLRALFEIWGSRVRGILDASR